MSLSGLDHSGFPVHEAKAKGAEGKGKVALLACLPTTLGPRVLERWFPTRRRPLPASGKRPLPRAKALWFPLFRLGVSPGLKPFSPRLSGPVTHHLSDLVFSSM